MLVLLIAAPSLGQQSLVGTYKLVSLTVEIDGTPSQGMGKAPHGYFVLTPTRAIMFYTADDRKFGTSVDEKAKLFNSMVAWSGVYRVEGNKIIYTYDASWTENINGTTAVLHWELSGNRLTVTTDPRPWPQNPSKTMINRRVWEKVE
jgi:hypothetical protein